MKTLAFIVAFSLVFSSLAISQSTAQSPASPQSTPSGTQSGSGAGQKKAPPTTPDRANAQTTVPADIKEVRRNLEALKTAVNKMDEGPEHDMAEQNVKFLESLVSYLEHENVARSSASRQRSK